MEQTWITGKALMAERGVSLDDLLACIKAGLVPHNRFNKPIPCPRYAHILNAGVVRVHKSAPIHALINNPDNREKAIGIILQKVQSGDGHDVARYVCHIHPEDYEVPTARMLQRFINDSILPALDAEIERVAAFTPPDRREAGRAPLAAPPPHGRADARVISRCILRRVADLRPILYRYLQGNDDRMARIRRKDPCMTSWRYFTMPEDDADRSDLRGLIEDAIFRSEEIETTPVKPDG